MRKSPIRISSCLLIVMAVGILLSACSQRQAALVEIGPTGNGYLLVTDIPVPSNPEKAVNYDFMYVGRVYDGQECLVFSAVLLDGEVQYEVGCTGLSAPGFVLARSVTVLEYSDD